MSLSPYVIDQISEAKAQEAINTLLRFIGEDPNRDGLRETPARVVKAWREMTAGHDEDSAEILSRTFDETSDELIMLRRISFYSMCEHRQIADAIATRKKCRVPGAACRSNRRELGTRHPALGTRSWTYAK